MTSPVNSLAWIIIAILFLVLFWHSWKIYNNLEKKRKNGTLKVQEIWQSNMSDIVKIFTECFKDLAIASMLACILSIVAALLPIFIWQLLKMVLFIDREIMEIKTKADFKVS